MGNIEACSELLKWGADPGIPANDGQNVLHLAAELANPNMMVRTSCLPYTVYSLNGTKYIKNPIPFPRSHNCASVISLLSPLFVVMRAGILRALIAGRKNSWVSV